MPQPGNLVYLVSPKGTRHLKRAGEGDDLHTNDGVVKAEDIIAAPYGSTVYSHLGRPYRVLKPALYDLLKGVKRQTQIIYPKEIGYICLKLGVGPGRRIIEAGSGSGGLTVALSWFAGEHGRVYTYERRPEFAALCRRNLTWAGVGDNVEQYDRDIAEGFAQQDVDALFLDVRTPWDYLDQAAAAVMPGAPLGFLLPTVNQVSDLLLGLEKGPFAEIEVLEIFLRRWKPVPERLRPDDRMVAHTGFLVFCRQQDRLPDLPEAEPLSFAPDLSGEEADPLDPAATDDAGRDDAAAGVQDPPDEEPVADGA